VFPAGAGVKDLAEHSGGRFAAGGLARPYGGQGDPDIDEQDQRRHAADGDQQYGGQQGHSDGGGDRAGWSGRC
jgi:hypothetical protein